MIVFTSNPSGRGRVWVRKRFIEAGDAYEPIIEEFTDPFGETRQHKRIYIPMGLMENRMLIEKDPSYQQNLMLATTGKPQLRKQWIEGDWYAESDGGFAGCFLERYNVVRVNEVIPNSFIYRSYDLGTASPFAVYIV